MVGSRVRHHMVSPRTSASSGSRDSSASDPSGPSRVVIGRCRRRVVVTRRVSWSVEGCVAVHAAETVVASRF